MSNNSRFDIGSEVVYRGGRGLLGPERGIVIERDGDKVLVRWDTGERAWHRHPNLSPVPHDRPRYVLAFIERIFRQLERAATEAGR